MRIATKVCIIVAVLLALATGTARAQITAAGGPIELFQTIQSAQTTGNGTTITPVREVDYVFYVEWGSSTSAGVITIEEAGLAAYSDTWSTLTTVTWAAADTSEAVHLTGIYSALRARISTTVVGGTVTVKVRGR